MPFKTFTAGEEALASDVNTYLMRQAVSSHATAAARTTAISAPTKGMISTRDDRTGDIEIWDGGAWVSTQVTGIWERTLSGVQIATGGNNVQSVAYTCSLAGALLIEGHYTLGGLGSGTPAQATNASFGGSTAAPTKFRDAGGDIHSAFQTETRYVSAVWQTVTRGQVVTIRLQVNNVGAGTAVAFAGFYFKIQNLAGPVGVF